MYQGNWKCSSCGGTITELPFQPRSESGLTCRTCFMKNRDKKPEARDTTDTKTPSHDALAEDAGQGHDAPARSQALYTGDWQCASCGNKITSLPFQPRDTSNLKCLNCFKNNRS